MEHAVASLPVYADCALIDGRDVPEKLTHIGYAYIKGDSRSVSIAAASIVAKVIRDRMMKQANFNYPAYGLAAHKGYGSKSHREAMNTALALYIAKVFRPLKQCLNRRLK